MKKIYMMLLALVAVFSLTGIGTALATDFRFTVPIQLNNIHPDVTSITTRCFVGILSSKTNKINEETAIGQGWTSTSMSPGTPYYAEGGNVTRNVIIQFNAPNPSDATHYECRLEFKKGTETRIPSTNTSPTTPTWARANSQEPFLVMTQGSLN